MVWQTESVVQVLELYKAKQLSNYPAPRMHPSPEFLNSLSFIKKFNPLPQRGEGSTVAMQRLGLRYSTSLSLAPF